MDLQTVNKREEWDEQLSLIPNASFLQSWEWANFQEYGLGKKVYRFKDWGLCIVEETRFGNILYCPRGPLLGWDDEASSKLLEVFVGAVGEMGFVALRIDPSIPVDSKTALELGEVGFVKSKSIVQVENAWVIDLFASVNTQEEGLFSLARAQGMNKKLPGEIRRAYKKGLVVKMLDKPGDIEIFLQLLHELSEEKGFRIRPDDYYVNQWKYMAPSGGEKLFVGFLDDKPIAVALVAFDQFEGSYLHAASIKGYSNLNAPSAVLWEAIKYSSDLGCERFNFWGVIKDRSIENQGASGYGYSKFKTRFGGREVNYVGTFDYSYNNTRYLAITLNDKYRTLLYSDA